MNKKGFTLIELMIVIAIIGILAALIIPILVNWTGGGSGSSNIVEYQQPTAIQVEPVSDPDTPAENANCLDGNRTIEINGEVFHLGKLKNSWGDLEAVKCE